MSACRPNTSQSSESIAVSGVSKSAVSERFVVGTGRKLDELVRRDLSGIVLAARMMWPA